MQLENGVNIAVVDDMEQDCRQIAAMAETVLQNMNVSHQISEYIDEADFMDSIRGGERYDILFLDVMMNAISGMDLAAKLRSLNIQASIVFVSSNREMAMYGYEVSAVRYLAKPLEEEKMKEALLYCLSLRQEKKEILLPTGQGQHRISISDIRFVEAFDRGTRFYLKDEKIECRMKFSEVEKLLPQPVFLTCHRSFIVNLSMVRSIRNFEFDLNGGNTVPIGKMRYPQVYQSFVEYITA